MMTPKDVRYKQAIDLAIYGLNNQLKVVIKSVKLLMELTNLYALLEVYKLSWESEVKTMRFSYYCHSLMAMLFGRRI